MVAQRSQSTVSPKNQGESTQKREKKTNYVVPVALHGHWRSQPLSPLLHKSNSQDQNYPLNYYAVVAK